MSRKLAATASSCPEDELLEALVHGALGRSERDVLAAHVDGCERCKGAIAKLGSGDDSLDDGTSTERPKRGLSSGDVIAGKYRIASTIGSGGMGTVYRALHIDLRTDVALKVLRTDRLGDAQAARRFAREAIATSSLKSANAVRTLDIDRLPNGTPYIVMEFLDGRDLGRAVATDGPLPIRDAVRYIAQACDAVGEAHALQIIHRDIKPANLFVTRSDLVKVLDFGLAKALPQMSPDGGSEAEATKTNFVLGSPHYMSPEQLQSPKDVDSRADIWSLGATLYHLICGFPPFFGPNLFVLGSRILNEQAPSLRERRPDAPPELEAIVVRCLKRKPEDRYPTCAALRLDLEKLLVKLPVAGIAPRPPAPSIPGAWPEPGLDSTIDAPAGRARAAAIPNFSDAEVDDVEPTTVGVDTPFAIEDDEADDDEETKAGPVATVAKLYEETPEEVLGSAQTIVMPETFGRVAQNHTAAMPNAPVRPPPGWDAPRAPPPPPRPLAAPMEISREVRIALYVIATIAIVTFLAGLIRFLSS